MSSHTHKFTWIFPIAIASLVFLSQCTSGQAPEPMKTLVVTATAYNSLPSQTHEDHPTIAAWGDKLSPGMKCIAVSRDLIPLGLGHRVEVSIKGLPGKYLVLDKMHARKKKSIDIYMGLDKEAALAWGRKKVTITWEDVTAPKDKE